MVEVKRTEFPFPDDLEGRINAIANVVNNPLKIATLLHLDDVLAEESDIFARIRESVGENVRLGRTNNYSCYCHNSLLPIGTVAEEVVRRDTGEVEHIGYKITEAGKKYGIPLGVFSLEWAVDNSLSFYSVLGNTASHGKTRAPLNRIKILRLLRQKGVLRQIDLGEEIGLPPQNIRAHLRNLQKIGFVNYKSVQDLHETKGDFFYYRFTGKEGRPETILTYGNLTKKILEDIKELGEANLHIISDRLNCSLHCASLILSRLAKQGFLKKVGEFKHRSLSKAEILDAGRKFVDEYVVIIEEALSDRPILRELSDKAEDFLSNDERARRYLTNSIRNHWKVSPCGNARPRAEINARIITYLEKNPGVRSRDIMKNLGFYSFSTFYSHLGQLIKAGILEKRQIDEQNKKAVGYFVAGSFAKKI